MALAWGRGRGGRKPCLLGYLFEPGTSHHTHTPATCPPPSTTTTTTTTCLPENALAPVARASGGVLPNFMAVAPPVAGTSGFSLIAADDVAAVLVRQVQKCAVGKHLGVNGALPVSLPELCGVIDGTKPRGTDADIAVGGEGAAEAAAGAGGPGTAGALTVGADVSADALAATLATSPAGWTPAQVEALGGAFHLAARGALFSTSFDVRMALAREETPLESHFATTRALWLA